MHVTVATSSAAFLYQKQRRRVSKRQIAASLSIGPRASMRRARYADLSWPLPKDLSDEAWWRLPGRRLMRLSGCAACGPPMSAQR